MSPPSRSCPEKTIAGPSPCHCSGRGTPRAWREGPRWPGLAFRGPLSAQEWRLERRGGSEVSPSSMEKNRLREAKRWPSSRGLQGPADPWPVVMTESGPVSSHYQVDSRVPPAPRPTPFPEHQDHSAELPSYLEATEGGLKASPDRAEDHTSQGKHSGIKKESPSQGNDTPPCLTSGMVFPPAHEPGRVDPPQAPQRCGPSPRGTEGRGLGRRRENWRLGVMGTGRGKGEGDAQTGNDRRGRGRRGGAVGQRRAGASSG